MKTTAIFSILLAASAASVFADGFVIIPPTTFLPNPVQVEVKYHNVDIKLTHQFAQVHIDQEFYNPNNYQVEGRYIFPIPEEAAISDFVLWIEGEKVHGEIKDADEALRIYQEIVSRMIDPAIFRYVGQDMFEARIFPFPAKGTRQVELDYQQLVRKDKNLYRFIYPLSTERFSSKDLESAIIKIDLITDEPIKNIYSPSHVIDIRYINSKHAEITWEERNVRPDKDFILYYSLNEEEVDMSLLTYKPKRGEDGYFILLGSVGSGEIESVPKDIVFVVDRSGSMRGERMEMVIDALSYCIENLGPDDRFNIITFASNTETLFGGLERASRVNVGDASDFVGDIVARGGTNIGGALDLAFSQNFSRTRPSFIVFLTDGYPTVGEMDLGRIVKKVEDFNGAKMFVFGIGKEEINAILLDAMSEAGRGLVEYVKDGDTLDVIISSFYDKISRPVLTDIGVNFGTVSVYDVVPRSLPDIFEGQQLIITGRYRGSGRTRISLTGLRGGSKQEVSFTSEFTEYSRELDFVGRYWAIRQVGTLLRDIRLNGENAELVNDIKALALEFGIVTPYTSYLVTENEEMLARPEFDAIRTMSSEMLTMDGALAPAMGEKSASGGFAVDVSSTINRMSRGTVQEVSHNPVVNYINGMAFTKQGDIWKQNGYEGQTTRKISYGSAEFYKLLADKPDAGDFISLGEVIFKIDDVWYEITR
ncbi:VWA domain-containing protein [candidate division WOR-3 bacterium]|nr:VWA domain-containing protein [candidate division WOR-3 bacterium]